MRVVFRADASSTIGSGHVMRCLTLAEALRRQDMAASFICREHDGHLCDLIAERGLSVTRLPPAAASWQDDAAETSAAMDAADPPDWLVVDHYGLDRQWEASLRTAGRRLMVIDDLADRPHECDLLLDQNLVADMYTRYADKVPAAAVTLLGPKFALLHPMYRELHERPRGRDGAVRRILVSFGGADRGNLTGRSLSAFLALDRPDIEVDVVIARNHPAGPAVRREAGGRANVHLHSGLPTLAPLMANADLAVGAGGATSWERLCLGLMTIVVTQAANQRPIAEELDRRGLIRWLGDEGDVDDAALTRALGRLIEEGISGEPRVPELDGRGADRVCAALSKAMPALAIRLATPADENVLLEWANDPETRSNAFSSAAIAPETHRTWFQARLVNRDGCRLYIAETSEGPAGHVRFERDVDVWEVHYALAPRFRGRGLGRRLLEGALKTFEREHGAAAVIGRVKDDNLPSHKVFRALGFAGQPATTPGVTLYRRVNDADR